MTEHKLSGNPASLYGLSPTMNAGPCPKCKSTATVLVGGAKHCNQCGLDFDQPRAIGKPYVIASGMREHYQEPGILIEQQALADKESQQ